MGPNSEAPLRPARRSLSKLLNARDLPVHFYLLGVYCLMHHLVYLEATSLGDTFPLRISWVVERMVDQFWKVV